MHFIFEISLCLLGIVAEIYSISPNSFPIELHNYYSGKFLGYATFLTFWNCYFTMLTFIGRIFCIFLKNIKKDLITLNQIFHSIFCLSFILSIIIMLGYWPLLFFDYNSFYPAYLTEKNIRNPILTDLCLHFFPFLNLLFLSWSIRIRYTLINYFFIIFVSILYVFLANITFYNDGVWPYPFLDQFGWLQVNVIFIFGILLGTLIFVILRSIQIRKLTKLKLEKMKPKLNKV